MSAKFPRGGAGPFLARSLRDAARLVPSMVGMRGCRCVCVCGGGGGLLGYQSQYFMKINTLKQ